MLCKKCKKKELNLKWDENGFGYSTILGECPNCGHIEVVEYVEDRCLDVNNDPRFYEYKKRSDLNGF